ncbi:MAG: hypothetical protein INQ03_00205 [Candidatus Heimdallarchaeota archaeon]|nr:hypothetical protein [Candidatus Heimdallarchaeota archaeon]
MESTKKVIICPQCGESINPKSPIHVVRKGPIRFKSYVAPINMIFLSLMMVLINVGTVMNNPNGGWWSLFVVIGLWLLYGLGIAMKFRSEEAWLILPFFFLLLSIYLGFIDVTTSDETPILFALSWSFYPIVVILILLVILPIVTFTGRSQRKPLEILKEIIELEDENREG